MKISIKAGAVIFLLVILCAPFTLCAEDTKVATTWEKKAISIGLSQAEINMLNTNRILITNDAYKQIFTPYIRNDDPVFITSDALLNAYHVLYEESVFRLETAMAEQLPEILTIILDNLEYTDDKIKGDPVLVEASMQRAKLIVGIAMKLVDDSFQFNEDKLDTILDNETQRIIEATWIGMPDWLAKRDYTFDKIDYSRYLPRSFYTRTEQLKRYFRATSWLQSIPFRLTNDEELLSIMMLGNTLYHDRFEDQETYNDIKQFFSAYSAFIGEGDDWDIVEAMHCVYDLELDLSKNDLEEARKKIEKRAGKKDSFPLINDLIRYPPKDPTMISEPNFRIISAYRTPGAILFQQTTDLRFYDRPYPEGLEIATSLGSSFARDKLTYFPKEKLIAAIDSCQTYFHGKSLYFTYFNALRALLDHPEKDAPSFMKTEAWQIKSCNTVLAGWAQLRHTWALQAKQSVMYLGIGKPIPAGFVEPEPDFFSRMTDLAKKTRVILNNAGAFNVKCTQLIENFQKYKSLLEGVENSQDYKQRVTQLSESDQIDISLPRATLIGFKTTSDHGTKGYYKEQVKRLYEIILDIKENNVSKYPYLEKRLTQFEFDIEKQWTDLENLCKNLEVIAHKQLRKVELNNDEISLIKRFGINIAAMMMYSGNSYKTPRDDAPRVVDVYFNPNRMGYLEVGIARARKMYVLYPWEGEDVLCSGAIMPYYEFVSPERLTDERWRETIDTESRPIIPSWLSPIVSEDNLSQPINLDD
jgi:hypothetical protein